MTIALSTALHTSFPDAVSRTREALAEQGFGVLTEIDMKATLKAKLGEDMEDYIILGACNPPLAHRAVNADRQIGLLLPCNVVVRADPKDDSSVIVEAMNPQILVEVTGEPALRDIADEVTTKDAGRHRLTAHHSVSHVTAAGKPAAGLSVLRPRVGRHTGLGFCSGALAAALGAGDAGAGSFSLFSINALTATMKLDPDIDRAAISGRRTKPSEGSKTPAAMGRAITL